MVDIRSLVPWRERSQAPAPREDFFDPFLNFRREVDRIFDSFFEGFGLRSAAGSDGWMSLAPALDVAESDKEVVVTAELPGVSEKDVEVTLADDLLTIKGEKKAEHEEKNGNFTYTERRYGSFSRSIRLPFHAGDAEVDAKYDKGVLTVRIPKPAEAQKAVRRIEVKAK
jgi:HSP20 family protein